MVLVDKKQIMINRSPSRACLVGELKKGLRAVYRNPYILKSSDFYRFVLVSTYCIKMWPNQDYDILVMSLNASTVNNQRQQIIILSTSPRMSRGANNALNYNTYVGVVLQQTRTWHFFNRGLVMGCSNIPHSTFTFFLLSIIELECDQVILTLLQ